VNIAGRRSRPANGDHRAGRAVDLGRRGRSPAGRAGTVAAAVLAALITASAALGLIAAIAAPASATDYRYWTYWVGHSGGSWGFAPFGAGQPLTSGTLVGWRFEVSPVGGSEPPRIATTFAQVCSGRTAGQGDELVGLVVDYGAQADAPPGEKPPRTIDTYCADVPVNATGAAVLDAYASNDVWIANGLICGIHGYPSPSSGCAVAVQPTPTPSPSRPRPSAGPTTARVTGGSASSGAASTAGSSRSGTSTAATATAGRPSVTQAASGSATAAATTGNSPGPQPVAVGSNGLAPVDQSSGVPWGAIAGGALIVAVAAAAVVRAIRRRT
jgi:hypothetical protein